MQTILSLILLVVMTGCSLFDAGELAESEQIAIVQSAIIKSQVQDCEAECQSKSGFKKKICLKKCDLRNKRAESRQIRYVKPAEVGFWADIKQFFAAIFFDDDEASPN